MFFAAAGFAQGSDARRLTAADVAASQCGGLSAGHTDSRGGGGWRCRREGERGVGQIERRRRREESPCLTARHDSPPMPKSLALGMEVDILALGKKLASASMERREGEKDVDKESLFLIRPALAPLYFEAGEAPRTGVVVGGEGRWGSGERREHGGGTGYREEVVEGRKARPADDGNWHVHQSCRRCRRRLMPPIPILKFSPLSARLEY